MIDVDAHPAPVAGRNRPLPGIPIPEQVNLDGPASGFDALALPAAFRGRPGPVGDAGTLRVRTPSGGPHVRYHTSWPGLRFRWQGPSGSRRRETWQDQGGGSRRGARAWTLPAPRSLRLPTPRHTEPGFCAVTEPRRLS
ncbi:hypothetical protein GCM10010259_49940 [Streptomyces daghestanicus]|uniref:Uncharacterized protein n=1 Tax=Streptomyces daghestanicus TaxID=66885 RepID=A0ABQ3PVU2_9ACTN|nr:hypothetical protein GCM10010259_49940 [Streptomyces daghestanicus]GHI29133.1 hypothetical protein Sdagh_08630 [Streptomyces daghestanicus]